jgi:hypothetical protein
VGHRRRGTQKKHQKHWQSVPGQKHVKDFPQEPSAKRCRQMLIVVVVETSNRAIGRELGHQGAHIQTGNDK